MDIKILNKQIHRNVEGIKNNITFTVDGVKFKIPIIYINIQNRKMNVFTDCRELDLLVDYISQNYDCDIQDFKKFLLYKLYEYSKGVNLDKPDIVNLTDVKIKYGGKNR